jgi:cytochrome P450
VTAELLTAGTETTATTLQWFFKAALENPKWIPEAQKEIDKVVGRSRLPDFSDRPNLLYLNAVVSELHRWASAAPLAFFHSTSSDDTYRSFTLPKAVTVIPNTYAIHHSEQYFPNPAEFLPGRWLPPSDPRHVQDGAKTPNHLAFGVGRRECPGKHVADASLFSAISRILWAFDISLGDHPPPGEETGTYTDDPSR